jgi:polyisoprenoid-binding protein YceI
VTFSIRFSGLTNVEGRFSEFSGSVLFDEQDWAKSSVTAVVWPRSISTGNEQRDTHLKSADFFDTEKFPTMVFQSTGIRTSSTSRDGIHGRAEALMGKLTIRGVTRDVQLTIRFAGQITDAGGHARIGFSAETRVKRSDFGITGGAWAEGVKNLGFPLLAEEVDVRLEIQANRWDFERLQFNSQQKPSIGEVLEKTLAAKGLEVALQEYREARANRADDFNFGAEELNLLGRRLLAKGRLREAKEIFRLNTEAFPQIAGAFVALGDAYHASGDSARATELYSKALALDQNSTAAMEALRRLKR